MVAAAVGQGNEVAVGQRGHFLGREALAAAGGEPEVLGVACGAEEGGFLALHEEDGFLLVGEEVLAEEALVELPGAGQLAAVLEAGVDPRGMAAAVAVGGVGHDLAGAWLLVDVDLPEDDVAGTCGAHMVAVEGLRGGVRGHAQEPLCEGRGVAARGVHQCRGQGHDDVGALGLGGLRRGGLGGMGVEDVARQHARGQVVAAGVEVVADAAGGVEDLAGGVVDVGGEAFLAPAAGAGEFGFF